MSLHRTNYTIKSDAKPDETKSFDYELQFRDYWGTPFFTATPNGTIALAAEGPHPCTRTDRASRFTPCVGRFVGIGTPHPVEKLHLVGTQYIESGELSIEERESENNYTITARRGHGRNLEVIDTKGKPQMTITSREANGIGARVPTARAHIQGSDKFVESTVSSLPYKPRMVNLLPNELVTYNFTSNQTAVDDALEVSKVCDCEPNVYGKCLSALVEPTSIRNEEEYSFEFHQKFHVGDVLSISLGTSLSYDVQAGKTEIGYDVTGSDASTLFYENFVSEEVYLNKCKETCTADPNCKGFVDDSNFIYKAEQKRVCVFKLEVHRPHDDVNSVLYVKKTRGC
jgi:hypothetical protein